MRLHIPQFCFVLSAILIFCSCSKNDDSNPTTLGTPSVMTIGVNSISTSSAYVSGKIVSNGGQPITEKGICFATTQQPNENGSKVIATEITDTFRITLSGLQPNTSYYIRAYAKNSNGTAYGNELSFRTSQLSADTATTLFVSGGYSKTLLALNAATGDTKWIKTLGDYIISSPIYANGKVFVTCNDRKIYAYDTSGNSLWTQPVAGLLSNNSPIVAQGNLYISTVDAVYAFNQSSGNTIWTFRKNGGNTLLVYKSNQVFYKSSDTLYALNAQTGSVNWRYRTGMPRGYPPVISDDRVFVLCEEYKLGVLNVNAGTQIFRTASSPFGQCDGINVRYGKVYASTEYITIADSATGAYITHTPVVYYYNYLDYIYGDGLSPILGNGFAFVAQNGGITILDATTAAYSGMCSGPGNGGPSGQTIIGDIIYYTYGNHAVFQPDGGTRYYGSVYAYNYVTRSVKWSKNFLETQFVKSTPCVVSGLGGCYRGDRYYQ